MRTLSELRQVTDPEQLRRFGSLRRLAITLTTKALWQLVGFRGLDGKSETMSVEPFTGIGFYARPPDGSKSEAIAVMIGDAGAPVIVAVRDEATRAKSAGDLASNESALYNSLVRVVARANGTIELAPIAGAVVEAMIKGQTYRAAEDTLLSALSTFVTAQAVYNAAIAAALPALLVGGAGSPAALIAAAATAAEGAVTSFQGAAATYLSQVGKVG